MRPVSSIWRVTPEGSASRRFANASRPMNPPSNACLASARERCTWSTNRPSKHGSHERVAPHRATSRKGAPMTAVIKTEKLTKSYGEHRGIVDVDMEVNEGEAFGFLGPNGAGKTTMIRTLLD